MGCGMSTAALRWFTLCSVGMFHTPHCVMTFCKKAEPPKSILFVKLRILPASSCNGVVVNGSNLAYKKIRRGLPVF